MTPQPPNPQSTDTQDELSVILKSELVSELREYYQQYPDVDFNDVSGYIAGYFARPQTKHLINSQALKLLDRIESKGRSITDLELLEYQSDDTDFEAIPLSALQEERKRYE